MGRGGGAELQEKTKRPMRAPRGGGRGVNEQRPRVSSISISPPQIPIPRRESSPYNSEQGGVGGGGGTCR